MHFDSIDLWSDKVPRSGPWHMAVDELLFSRRTAQRPILRFYRWVEPSISVGYFEPYHHLEAAIAARRVPVRRWTGGGIVEHGDDLTYALVVPAGAGAGSALRAKAVYGWVHERLCQVLREAGITAEMAVNVEDSESRECFRKPVACDVIVAGKKVAGAGQKRTRDGLLHQGSIQGVELPGNFEERFAHAMAPRVHENETVLEGREPEIESLVQQKYGSESWLRRFP